MITESELEMLTTGMGCEKEKLDKQWLIREVRSQTKNIPGKEVNITIEVIPKYSPKDSFEMVSQKYQAIISNKNLKSEPIELELRGVENPFKRLTDKKEGEHILNDTLLIALATQYTGRKINRMKVDVSGKIKKRVNIIGRIFGLREINKKVTLTYLKQAFTRPNEFLGYRNMIGYAMKNNIQKVTRLMESF